MYEYKVKTMKMNGRTTLGILFLLGSAAAVADGTHPHMHKSDAAKSSAMHDHWMAPPEAARTSNPIPAKPESIQRGREIYKRNCVSCHGAKGEGNGPAANALPTPPADLAKMAPQHSDGDLAWKIAEGRAPMPAWEGVLSEHEIWHVVNYLKKGLGSETAKK